jgi:hypothetical protein
VLLHLEEARRPRRLGELAGDADLVGRVEDDAEDELRRVEEDAGRGEPADAARARRPPDEDRVAPDGEMRRDGDRRGAEERVGDERDSRRPFREDAQGQFLQRKYAIAPATETAAATPSLRPARGGKSRAASAVTPSATRPAARQAPG